MKDEASPLGFEPIETFYHVLNEQRDVVPATKEEWQAATGGREVIVARTTVGEHTLQTFFTGKSYEGDDEPPLLFESWSECNGEHWEEDLYATWEEAERGHAGIIVRWESIEEAG